MHARLIHLIRVNPPNAKLTCSETEALCFVLEPSSDSLYGDTCRRDLSPYNKLQQQFPCNEPQGWQ